MGRARPPVNPNQLFDLSRENVPGMAHFSSVLRTGELFRYFDSSEESINSQLESATANYLGHEAAATVSSGTVGLRLALRALGIHDGHRVLVCAHSFIGCAMAVLAVGATPVPMDMEDVLTLALPSAEWLADAVDAVMVVHVQGHALPTQELRRLCDCAGVPLIEDICQALGSSSIAGLAGSVGDVAITSFQQSKQISAGEGGIVVGSASVVEDVYRMMDLGAVRGGDGRPNWDDDRSMIADNLRLTELQAALALDQLEALDATLAMQRAVRASLLGQFDPGIATVRSSDPAGDAASHLLVLARDADSARALCGRLAEHAVIGRAVWGRTFPEYEVMRRMLGPDVFDTPRAVDTAPRLVSIPTPKYLSATDVTLIARALESGCGFLADPAVTT